jgi:Reverse transcriptase (RNA-dependent DNA polymerase)
MNVKTVFLNDDIDEIIYLMQHENFALGDSKSIVYKLNKSIYRLKKKHLVNCIINFIKL